MTYQRGPATDRKSFHPSPVLLEGRTLPSTITVGNDPKHPGQYPTIEAAVLAAPPNSRIVVEPGVYAESVEIPADKAGLTLVSDQPLRAVIRPPGTTSTGGAAVDVDGARGVTLQGFTVDGSAGTTLFDVLVQNGGSASLTGNHLTGASIGVRVGNFGTGSADVEGNLIDNANVSTADIAGTSGDVAGVSVPSAGDSAVVVANVIVGLGPIAVAVQNGVEVGYGGTATIRLNLIGGNLYTGPGGSASGVDLYQSGAVNVDQNILYGNDFGVQVEAGSSQIVVSHNGASQSTYAGIALRQGTTGATVDHNNTSGNLLDGILVDTGATGNTLSHNTASFNGRDGIHLESDASGNAVDHNQMSGNGRFDAYDASAGPYDPPALVANPWTHNQFKTTNRPGLQ